MPIPRPNPARRAAVVLGLVLVLLLLGLIIATAFAPRAVAAPGVPHPDSCEVHEMITLVPSYTPDLVPWLNRMWIRDSLGDPVVGALVEILIDTPDYNMLCWCPASDPGTYITGVTDANGYVSFPIQGGGCVPAGAATVHADGVFLRSCGINSPDVVDNLGHLATNPAYIAGTYDEGCGVNVQDAVWHTYYFLPALDQPCSEFAHDDVEHVSAGDMVFLTPFIIEQAACPGGGPTTYTDPPTLAHAKLGFHMQATIPGPCFAMSFEPSCDNSGFTNTNTTGALAQGYCVYMVVMDIDPAAGLTGVTFSLDYTTGFENLYLGNWLGLGYQHYHPDAWPYGGSVINVMQGPWDQCTVDIADGDAEGEAYAVVSAMYAYAYAPGELVYEADPNIHLVDCNLVLTDLSAWPDHLGRAGFGVAGYNPCLAAPLDAGNPAGSPRFGAYPNPTTGPLTVSFAPDSRWAAVDVFDVLGRRVARVFEGAPETAVRWDGRVDSGSRAPNGVYFLRVETDRENWSKRIMVIR